MDRPIRETLAFVGVDFTAVDALWPTRFMPDSEMRWLTAEAAIDDF